ncbi:alpha/beta fold hydrolase [Pendulispora albinea]|uniref:Lysophospholipase n=1 Tax=Pendulispora albinea TaxID=2741071 RepID=A0ABZ2LRS6_9BACT
MRSRARSYKPKTASIEAIEVHTSDGIALRATVQEGFGPARGTAILAHGEFGSRRAFEARAGGFAKYLTLRGWRTVAFDFRGHGESGPADFTYDDLVRGDLATVASCARARWSGPLAVVGHALGGHVALAGCGTSVVDADAVALVGSNVWLPQLEPSDVRWRAKRAAMEFFATVVQAHGYFPARSMGLGSEDEPASLMNAAVRAAREGTWRSEDGSLDYERALGQVRVPVLAVASAADEFRCAPECAERMLSRCAGPRDFRVIAHDDEGGRAPRDLIAGRRASNVWATVADWLESI